MNSDSWDLFICHAHEDQDAIAWPLKQHLEELGMRVWLDKHNIQVGDSIRQQIDKGIGRSRYGVVVLSHSFFEATKFWVNFELDGLVAKAAGAGKALLPIWHKVSIEDVRKYSFPLSGLHALNTGIGLPQVARELKRVVVPPLRRKRRPPRQVDNIVDRFVAAARKGKFDSGAFSSYIDSEAMYRLRTRFKEADTTKLLSMMKNQEFPGRVRNIIASVLLGQRMKEAPKREIRRIRNEMSKYYSERSDQEAKNHCMNDSWLVSRGIAIALAGTANRDDQGEEYILDWVGKLVEDKLLLEKNLETTDEYQNGPEAAVEHYCKSITQWATKYPLGRLWEVFYLEHRAEHRDQHVIEALETCKAKTNHLTLRSMCEKAILSLS
jgi:TIR domain